MSFRALYLQKNESGFTAGVTTLEDLVAMSATRMDGTFNKIRLAEGVPRGAGVYRFLGASGQTLYVGKATDLRSRVRSYFQDSRPRDAKTDARAAKLIGIMHGGKSTLPKR